MRLDLESVSGPLPLQRLGLEGPELGSIRESLAEPPPPPPEAKAFDPSSVGIDGGTSPIKAPALPLAPHPEPMVRPGPSIETAAAPPPSRKPEWQSNLDRGISQVASQSKEATARFGGWFRTLGSSEQMAFVAGAVLGILIVLMLFAYWIM
jgi:hypothetical protein